MGFFLFLRVNNLFLNFQFVFKTSTVPFSTILGVIQGHTSLSILITRYTYTAKIYLQNMKTVDLLQKVHALEMSGFI